MPSISVVARGQTTVRMRFIPGLVGATGSVTPEMIGLKDEAAVSAQIASDAASDAASQSNVPLYSSRDALAALVIPVGINFLRTNGRTASNDGDPGNYVYSDVEPAIDDKKMTANGRWFARSPDWNQQQMIDLRLLGGDGTGGAADATAWAQAALVGKAIVMRPGNWLISSNLTITNDIVFEPGAKLVGVGAPTVYFQGNITAGPNKIFEGLTANLWAARCEKAYYEWWGARGGRNPSDPATLPDSTAAINAAWFCGHNHPTGYAFSYRHTGTLYGKLDKVCYGPAPNEPECEMWLDDPTGLLSHIVIGKSDNSPLYSPVIGNMVRARMQAATAGACVSLSANIIQPFIYGRDYNDLANKKTWTGLHVGPKCQDIHDRRVESIGNQNAGFYCSISQVADKVIGIYFECGYIRDSAVGISLYGFVEGVFSDQKLLLFNNTTNISAACASAGDLNVVKILGGDNDTGGTGYYFDKVGAVSIRQWLSNLTTRMGFFRDCLGLDLAWTHAYAQAPSTEGLEFQGCTGVCSISDAAGGVYTVRIRQGSTGQGCQMVFDIGKALNDQYAIIENSIAQGTNAKNVVKFVGYKVGGAATLRSAPSEPTTEIITYKEFV